MNVYLLYSRIFAAFGAYIFCQVRVCLSISGDRGYGNQPFLIVCQFVRAFRLPFLRHAAHKNLELIGIDYMQAEVGSKKKYCREYNYIPMGFLMAWDSVKNASRHTQSDT